MRWEGDTIRVIGDWHASADEAGQTGRVFSFRGDAITARVVNSAAPSRVDSIDDLHTDFARSGWEELGLQASIVAAGRPQPEVMEAVTREVGQVFAAQAVNFVRWEGVPDEVRVVGG